MYGIGPSEGPPMTKREGKNAAGATSRNIMASMYPNYYAPRHNPEEFLNGIKRQAKFEIGCWPDAFKPHEIAPDILAAGIIVPF